MSISLYATLVGLTKGKDIIIRIDRSGKVFVREVVWVVQDDIRDEMVYHCTTNDETDDKLNDLLHL